MTSNISAAARRARETSFIAGTASILSHSQRTQRCYLPKPHGTHDDSEEHPDDATSIDIAITHKLAPVSKGLCG
jgi:hypothetical protein